MSRELKFHAWDTKNKRWYRTELEFKGFSLFGECMLVCPPRIEDLEHIEVDQYTGLKDFKNSVEIYESDLAKTKNGVIHEVRFADGSYYLYNDEYGHIDLTANSVRVYEIEIIGNARENSEPFKKD